MNRPLLPALLFAALGGASCNCVSDQNSGLQLDAGLDDCEGRWISDGRTNSQDGRRE